MTSKSQYDLTGTLSPFLDPHLILQMLEFLRQDGSIYAKDEVAQSELQVAQKTKLFGRIKDLLAQTGQQQDDIDSSEKKCQERLKSLKSAVGHILQFMSEGRVKEISSAIAPQHHHHHHHHQQQSSTDADRPTSGLQYVRQKYSGELDIGSDHVDQLYELARIEFDSGSYEAAAEHLQYFRLLTGDVEKGYMAQWGRVCALLANQTEWDNMRTDVFELRELIESSAVHDAVFKDNPLLVLQHRSWFIHWVLFVFFRSNNDRPDTSSEKSALVDLYFQDRYLNAIQTNCPHILRYFVAAMVIAHKRRRTHLKELTRMLDEEQIAYNDPVTKFLESLYVKADFDAAQQWLRECEEQVLSVDFFLRSYKEEFLDNARLIIFELYCRIHRVVQISSIAERLNMDPSSAEKWIIDVIRNNKYSAKIDAETKSVILQEQQHNIYQQILEKTEALVDRTNLLDSNVERNLA